MTDKKEFAKKAALATYNAVMGMPMKKVATFLGSKEVAPSAQEVARVAAESAYRSVIKQAELLNDPRELLVSYPAISKVVDCVTNNDMTSCTREDVVAALNEWRDLYPILQARIAEGDMNAKTFGKMWQEYLGYAKKMYGV